jgi:hypothetical protein
LIFLQVSGVLALPVQTPLLRTSGNGNRASNEDVRSYLSAHNTVRTKHGAVALKWNNNLAVAAQKWGDKCVFKHSGGTLGQFGGMCSHIAQVSCLNSIYLAQRILQLVHPHLRITLRTLCSCGPMKLVRDSISSEVVW